MIWNHCKKKKQRKKNIFLKLEKKIAENWNKFNIKWKFKAIEKKICGDKKSVLGIQNRKKINHLNDYITIKQIKKIQFRKKKQLLLEGKRKKTAR